MEAGIWRGHRELEGTQGAGGGTGSWRGHRELEGVVLGGGVLHSHLPSQPAGPVPPGSVAPLLSSSGPGSFTLCLPFKATLLARRAVNS